jgi:hypothetical protein
MIERADEEGSEFRIIFDHRKMTHVLHQRIVRAFDRRGHGLGHCRSAGIVELAGQQRDPAPRSFDSLYVFPRVAFGAETITASVPFTAPGTPPLTDASTQPILHSASAWAMLFAALGPVVDRSMTVLTNEP